MSPDRSASFLVSAAAPARKKRRRDPQRGLTPHCTPPAKLQCSKSTPLHRKRTTFSAGAPPQRDRSRRRASHHPILTHGCATWLAYWSPHRRVRWRAFSLLRAFAGSEHCKSGVLCRTQVLACTRSRPAKARRSSRCTVRLALLRCSARRLVRLQEISK
jgi:hypothetical protein